MNSNEILLRWVERISPFLKKNWVASIDVLGYLYLSNIDVKEGENTSSGWILYLSPNGETVSLFDGTFSENDEESLGKIIDVLRRFGYTKSALELLSDS